MSQVDDVLLKIDNEIENYNSVKTLKEQTGRPIIGWLPTDVPEEIIHALGAIPVGIIPAGEGGGQGRILVPDYVCLLVKGVLDKALDGNLSFLDGLIIPHVCDSLKQISGIWQNHAPLPYIRDLLLPSQYFTKSALKFYQQELKEFTADLGNFLNVSINDEALKNSIELYNHNRQLLRHILNLRLQNSGLLGNKHYYKVIKSSMLMPKERNNELLEELISAMQKNEKSTTVEFKTPLLMSGMFYAEEDFFGLLDELGIIVVGDDLSDGERYFAVDVDLKTSDDIYGALALRQNQNLPFSGFEQEKDRRKFLIELSREREAKGIIFLHLKFCEQENFDYPLLKRAVDEHNISSIRLEMGYPPSLGPVRNRLEAMLEMMEGI